MFLVNCVNFRLIKAEHKLSIFCVNTIERLSIYISSVLLVYFRVIGIELAVILNGRFSLVRLKDNKAVTANIFSHIFINNAVISTTFSGMDCGSPIGSCVFCEHQFTNVKKTGNDFC